MSNVAHELRAPLTNIRGYIEALGSGVLASTPEIIKSLQEETLRLGNLTDDLMHLSVADAARLTLRKAKFNLREFSFALLEFVQTPSSQTRQSRSIPNSVDRTMRSLPIPRSWRK